MYRLLSKVRPYDVCTFGVIASLILPSAGGVGPGVSHDLRTTGPRYRQDIMMINCVNEVAVDT